tara:strand:+ start:1137 stop:1412 length:276 start_codon:yes stop_codon:yes gene_type:complete
MSKNIKEAKTSKSALPSGGAAVGKDELFQAMLKKLTSIESLMKSLVHYQQPSRGFEAGLEKAIAQPFVSESKTEEVKKMIREALRDAMGDK